MCLLSKNAHCEKTWLKSLNDTTILHYKNNKNINNSQCTSKIINETANINSEQIGDIFDKIQLKFEKLDNQRNSTKCTYTEEQIVLIKKGDYKTYHLNTQDV